MFRIIFKNGVNLATPTDDEGKIVPEIYLINSGTGGGKTIFSEELIDFHYRNTWTIISISDQKNQFEQAFSMFDPIEPYHLRSLRKFGCPKGARPTKLHHPFTFNIPTYKLPEIDFYTINTKTGITRIDLNFLAESPENKNSTVILLDVLNKLKPNEGLQHLVYYAEDQTESMSNIMKSKVKFRSDDAEKFFTKSKIGTDKTASEFTKFFTPFQTDFTLAPANCKHNLDIVEVMNDQKHQHIFSQKWIKDKRQKRFYILNLLQQIIEHKDEAKYPILIVIEEVKSLLPETSEGYVPFLAKELSEQLATMRNTGKGFGCVMTTQVYKQTHHEITSMADPIFGKQKGLQDIESISKSLNLNSTEKNILIGLQRGEFLIRAKQEYDTEATLQKIKPYLPPHAHNEVGTNFFEIYANKYPERMTDYKDLIKEMQTIKQKTIDDVSILKDKENQMKNAELKKVKDEKMTVQKDKLKIELAKIQNKTEKTEAISQQLKHAIYQEWLTQTDPKKKTQTAIAKKFGILLSNGTPNHKQIGRIINEMTTNETNTEVTQETSEDLQEPTQEEQEGENNEN